MLMHFDILFHLNLSKLGPGIFLKVACLENSLFFSLNVIYRQEVCFCYRVRYLGCKHHQLCLSGNYKGPIQLTDTKYLFIRTDCRSQWYISFTNRNWLLAYANGSSLHEQSKFGTRGVVFILKNCKCSAYLLISEINFAILITTLIFRHREFSSFQFRIYLRTEWTV
jgi:hypothetical protein